MGGTTGHPASHGEWVDHHPTNPLVRVNEHHPGNHSGVAAQRRGDESRRFGPRASRALMHFAFYSQPAGHWGLRAPPHSARSATRKTTPIHAPFRYRPFD